ncbi:MAG TPA: GNAT family N-acetyltransferase, partial [Defluviitaleaceae bacterium]|nr:GNAT family N-acetyltransferase [Defluviitaleaceae bacterium]
MWFMKKQFKHLKIYHSDDFNKIKLNIKLPYPFEKDLLRLLKKENKFEQEYYYLEQGKDYAFFVLYKNKMNIFTFGKLKFNMKLKVIGYPCSLSNAGYVTNNEKMMLDYIKSLKGAKLVLNVSNPTGSEGITVGQTLPTCVFYNRFHSVTEYLTALRSSYRRRINKAIKNCEDLEIKINDETIDVYDLYLNTYNKSDYKLEKLESNFFKVFDGTKIVFLKDKKAIGFVLLKKVEDKLIFMFCGMDYRYNTADLYYYMLYKIIEYAIDRQCKIIDFGQTSEETKMKLGALLEKRYFYAHHSNPIINFLVNIGKDFLEYKYDFPQYRVFKEG